ncbi:MAG: hypothetical protein MUC28_02290 [Planctomycetes bacterium]|jgi:hypothetical protein|nr:hypothetical protein [Planctomycetota bacterium]
MFKKEKIIIAIILIAIGVAGRLAPHPWNFAPVAAVALFAGVYLGGRYALLVPAISMLIGDLFIGFYEWPLMLTVYLSYPLIGGMGVAIRRYKSAETVLAGSLVGSVIFFLLTNWAVWQFSPWYAQTWEGLLSCYTLALPFFRHTVLGDLFYAGALFGIYELVSYSLRAANKKVELIKVMEK